MDSVGPQSPHPQDSPVRSFLWVPEALDTSFVQACAGFLPCRVSWEVIPRYPQMFVAPPPQPLPLPKQSLHWVWPQFPIWAERKPLSFLASNGPFSVLSVSRSFSCLVLNVNSSLCEEAGTSFSDHTVVPLKRAGKVCRLPQTPFIRPPHLFSQVCRLCSPLLMGGCLLI